MRDHRLVGGDEALARAQSGAREGERGAVRTADQLDHHVDIIAPGERGHVVFPGEAGDVDAAILAAVTRGDRDDLDRATGARGDQRGVGIKQADHARADSAKPGNSDAQRLCGGGGQSALRWKREAALSRASRAVKRAKPRSARDHPFVICRSHGPSACLTKA